MTCVDESMKMDGELSHHLHFNMCGYIVNTNITGYLFLDSNATTDMYYTLCIYGNCTNDVTPNLFVQALNQM